MNQYVADTHALFWYLVASPKLGQAAKKAFDEAVQGLAVIYLPVVVLAELKFPLQFHEMFQQLQQSEQFLFVSLHPQDVLDFNHDMAVPEMHDRMIVGVARRFNVPCLTRDPHIIQSGLVRVVWD